MCCHSGVVIMFVSYSYSAFSTHGFSKQFWHIYIEQLNFYNNQLKMYLNLRCATQLCAQCLCLEGLMFI